MSVELLQPVWKKMVLKQAQDNAVQLPFVTLAQSITNIFWFGVNSFGVFVYNWVQLVAVEQASVEAAIRKSIS